MGGSSGGDGRGEEGGRASMCEPGKWEERGKGTSSIGYLFCLWSGGEKG